MKAVCWFSILLLFYLASSFKCKHEGKDEEKYYMDEYKQISTYKSSGSKPSHMKTFKSHTWSSNLDGNKNATKSS
uniref:Uncharacterized protein n=1 Tax=Trichobilharzia regenti TaxID=157069 RepID=A0AA85JFC3_TRIRE|nr:unnamed protein product [Trichobilharzia regenti]